jgi:hypothetical protein
LRSAYAHGAYLRPANWAQQPAGLRDAIGVAHELARLTLLLWVCQTKIDRQRLQSLEGSAVSQLARWTYRETKLWQRSRSYLDQQRR